MAFDPDRVNIGPYYGPDWAGLVFSDQPSQGAAVRFIVSRRGERADHGDLHYLVHEVGPRAGDGAFARIGFDTTLPFTQGDETPLLPKTGRTPTFGLEWSRVGADRVVGRVRIAYRGVCEVRGYFPWDWVGSWTVDRSDLVAGWGTADSGVLVQVVHRPHGRRSERGRALLDPSGEAGVRFSVEPESILYVDARLIKGDPDPVRSGPNIDEIEDRLVTAASEYENRRVTCSGPWSDLAPSITNSIHWTVLLQPETGALYAPAGRRWLFPASSGGRDHWTTFAWDGFFNALELAVESPTLAESTTTVVLETQYPNGNVPNWRGRFGGTPDRSQPPVGSFAVLKQYLRTGRREFLEATMPFLERWNAWWRGPKGKGVRRDGNGNGLFNWGSDLDARSPTAPEWEREVDPRQYARWESGQDDLPLWDDARWVAEAETLDLDAVDLNSYLALDYECLSIIARELGNHDKEMWYAERQRALQRRVNEVLWDDEQGMFLDRHWDGERSTRIGAANFLPLVAGIPSQEQAARMVRVLTNPDRMWGRYVVPSVSRDDAAFSDQQYWRGAIWPPLNYLIYQGLRRYGFDDVAAELAQRSVDLYLDQWQRFQVFRENYDSQNGKGGGQRYQSWGPLMALIGLEEFVDITPWDGLRFGTPRPPGNVTLRRLPLFGQDWDVSLRSLGMVVSVNGVDILSSNGPLVLRQVTFDATGLTATTKAAEPVTLVLPTVSAPLAVTLDDATTHVDSPKVDIPAGAHTIRVASAST